MDILIKNMEMPSEGRIINLTICSDGSVINNLPDAGGKMSSYRSEKAKAVALPEHGEKCCGNCKWCHEGHYEEEGEQPYIKRKCTNKYGLTPNYSIYEYDYCSRWEASDGADS